MCVHSIIVKINLRRLIQFTKWICGSNNANEQTQLNRLRQRLICSIVHVSIYCIWIRLVSWMTIRKRAWIICCVFSGVLKVKSVLMSHKYTHIVDESKKGGDVNYMCSMFSFGWHLLLSGSNWVCLCIWVWFTGNTVAISKLKFSGWIFQVCNAIKNIVSMLPLPLCFFVATQIQPLQQQ